MTVDGESGEPEERDLMMHAFIPEHDRYGGGSVMVWGGTSFDGTTDLHVVAGTLTFARYRDEILQILWFDPLQVQLDVISFWWTIMPDHIELPLSTSTWREREYRGGTGLHSLQI